MADIECHQKSSALKHIPFELWCNQERIFGGQNRVAPGNAQEVKEWVGSMGKLQNGGGARGRCIDLLLGNVTALHRGKFCTNEILNEGKTNVGEPPF